MSSPRALTPSCVRSGQIRVRVRTGCFTCKKRRIKCDETRPACLRCIHTGRTCDGYPSDRHPNLLTTSFYSFPFRVPGSQHDRQVFHYYYTCAATDMCGFSPGSSDFWGRLVLETSFHQPVVREMLIALAAIHRDYATFDSANGAFGGPKDSTVGQYNKALRKFRNYVSTNPNPNREYVIVCCILFHCFEIVRGEYGWAVKHLETATQVLETCRPGSLDGTAPSSSNESLETLRATLVRLDLQLSAFDDSRLPLFSLASKGMMTGSIACIGSRFESPSDAQRTLETLQNWLLRFLITRIPYKFVSLDALPPLVWQELQSLRSQLALWDARFRDVTLRHPPDAEKGKHFASMQLTHRLCSAMSFAYPHAVYKAEFAAELQDLFMQVSMLLACEPHGVDSLPRSVSCDIAVVMPLFLLAVKCRDPVLRKAALDTLAGLKRQEGLMSSTMMAGIVANAMELEFEGRRFPEEGEDAPAVEEWASTSIDAAGDYHDLAASLRELTTF